MDSIAAARLARCGLAEAHITQSYIDKVSPSVGVQFHPGHAKRSWTASFSCPTHAVAASDVSLKKYINTAACGRRCASVYIGSFGTEKEAAIACDNFKRMVHNKFKAFFPAQVEHHANKRTGGPPAIHHLGGDHHNFPDPNNPNEKPYPETPQRPLKIALRGVLAQPRLGLYAAVYCAHAVDNPGLTVYTLYVDHCIRAIDIAKGVNEYIDLCLFLWWLERARLGSCLYCLRKLCSLDVAGPRASKMMDRMDSDLGYTVANTAFCCDRCQLAKGTMSVSTFVRAPSYNLSHLLPTPAGPRIPGDVRRCCMVQWCMYLRPLIATKGGNPATMHPFFPVESGSEHTGRCPRQLPRHPHRWMMMRSDMID
jgi:hypothetical protein